MSIIINRQKKVTMRPINEIAREIKREWKAPYFGAVPYLNALQTLSTKQSMYGCDSASSIINYFLSNATTFRGEAARRLKTELKEHLK